MVEIKLSSINRQEYRWIIGVLQVSGRPPKINLYTLEHQLIIKIKIIIKLVSLQVIKAIMRAVLGLTK